MLELDGDQDYRERPGYRWGDYGVVLLAEQGALAAAQLALSAAAKREVTLTVNRRRLALRAREAERAWLYFDVLCREPRSSADMLWLAEEFQLLALSGVPLLNDQDIDVQERFLNFIDIFYDHGNQLLLVSEVPPERLLSAGTYVDFSRTGSRLQQLWRLPDTCPLTT